MEPTIGDIPEKSQSYQRKTERIGNRACLEIRDGDEEKKPQGKRKEYGRKHLKSPR